MNIAIASNDGVNVNEHFGRATNFFIFEVHEETFNLVMVSKLDEPYAAETKSHTFDNDKFMKIAEKLKLCQKVFITKIGDAPAKAFSKIGIDTIVYSGPISEISIDP